MSLTKNDEYVYKSVKWPKTVFGTCMYEWMVCECKSGPENDTTASY